MDDWTARVQELQQMANDYDTGQGNVTADDYESSQAYIADLVEWIKICNDPDNKENPNYGDDDLQALDEDELRVIREELERQYEID